MPWRLRSEGLGRMAEVMVAVARVVVRSSACAIFCALVKSYWVPLTSGHANTSSEVLQNHIQTLEKSLLNPLYNPVYNHRNDLI